LPVPIPPHVLVPLPARSGAELIFKTIFEIRDIVLERLDRVMDGTVLITGTDTLEECAFCLEMLLGERLRGKRRSLVVTAAMKPADVLGADGLANVEDAIRAAMHPTSKKCGVLVLMTDTIHLASSVSKSDSQLVGSFRSNPVGAIGQTRSGKAVFYYNPPKRSPLFSFKHLSIRHVEGIKVCIWIVTVSSFLPETLLEELDGLVLACPGSGSLPFWIVEKLHPKWTSKIPIVIATRCSTGENHDDFYYRGSKEKYVAKGFVLDGYEGLNYIQARNALMFSIAENRRIK